MKQPPTFPRKPRQEPGESDKAYARRLSRWLAGDDIRSKGDMREWTGAPPFHLNKETT